MNAVISGTAGRALLIDGNSLKSFDVDDPSKVVVRRQADVPYLFGEGRDLRILENADLDTVVKELNSESDLSLALDLTLISLDEELEEDIRQDAIKDLDELLTDPNLRERLEGIMYASPLPDDGDLVGALKLCGESRLPNSFALLQNLERRQPLISKVGAAWEVIPITVFGGYEQQVKFEQVAARQGLFRSLILNLETSQPVSTFLLGAGLDHSIKQMPNYRQVLQVWAGPFREVGELRIIQGEFEEEHETRSVHRRKRGRRVDIDRQAVLSEVNRRKEIISGAIQRRDLEIVRELTDDLVEYQLRSGEAEHVAKSLCDLAMEAKELGMFSLQLALTERSISVASSDGWSWAQHGDALLNTQKLEEALKAYQQAEAFGELLIGQTGRAWVLKAKGELDEALALYNEIISQHPEDVIAKTGRAEVLKAKGELDEALAAYNEVISQHPESTVAKSGRAGVLKAKGELDEALALYNEIISQHPEDVVAKSGRAEVLKAKGELDEALAAYNEVISQHPDNVVAKTGRAEVLKAKGELNEALVAYTEVIGQHPENVFAKNGRAEVLKAKGELDEALATYNEVIGQHPEDAVARNGRAEVLKAKGELDEALAAYDEVISRYPENLFAKNGRAEVLKAKGELGEALSTYERIIRERPENRVARTGRLSILVVTGRYEEALEFISKEKPVTLDDWIDYHILGMIRLRTGKMIEAIRIFDEGSKSNPWPSSWDYFSRALGLAWLRGRDFRKASEALDRVKAPLLQPAANVLRIHAFGAQGDVQRASVAYESLSTTPHLRSNELTQELRRQFILKEPPLKNDEWIADREDQIHILAA